MSRLRIAEIFTSLQGEGLWTGVSSTFVRVSGCNLRCRWCDTPYASFKPEGPTMSVSEIVSKVEESGTQHVVLTGGEPMLFEPTVDLAGDLSAKGHTITIESAGTVYRKLTCDLMSLSPKPSNSTPDRSAGAQWPERHEKTRLDRDPLRQLIRDYDCQLKFVVDPETSPSDIDEIDALLSELPNLPSSRIFLMPEGIDSTTLTRREKLLAPICSERGWQLCPRMQIHWFGNTRGT